MGNPYIPWDVELVFSGFNNLRSTFGVAITTGLWIFIIVSGIYLVIKIVNSLGG